MNLSKTNYGDSDVLAKEVSLKFGNVDLDDGYCLILASVVLIVEVPQIIGEKRIPRYESRKIEIEIVPMSLLSDFEEINIQCLNLSKLYEGKLLFVIPICKILENKEQELSLRIPLSLSMEFSLPITKITSKKKVYKLLMEQLDAI